MEYYDPSASYSGLETCIESMGFGHGILYGLGLSQQNGWLWGFHMVHIKLVSIVSQHGFSKRFWPSWTKERINTYILQTTG